MQGNGLEDRKENGKWAEGSKAINTKASWWNYATWTRNKKGKKKSQKSWNNNWKAKLKQWIKPIPSWNCFNEETKLSLLVETKINIFHIHICRRTVFLWRKIILITCNWIQIIRELFFGDIKQGTTSALNQNKQQPFKIKPRYFSILRS